MSCIWKWDVTTAHAVCVAVDGVNERNEDIYFGWILPPVGIINDDTFCQIRSNIDRLKLILVQLIWSLKTTLSQESGF